MDTTLPGVEDRATNRNHARTCSIIVSIALAVLIAGCGTPIVSPPPASPAPTPTPVATFTGSGMLHLTAAPEYDWHDPLQLRYVFADGSVAAAVDAFPASTTIFLDRTLPAGPVQVLANGQACGRPVMIQADAEVDVVLSVVDDVCDITTTDSHAPGAIAHPEPRTAIGVFVVVDSILVVTPLDPGNAIEPIRRPAGDRAEVQDFEVPPGRYELALLVDDSVLNTMEIDLKRGQEFWFNLRALPADFPIECGSIPAGQCEAAVLAAYAKDYSGDAPSAHVTSAQVVPSRTWAGCTPPLSEVPVLDVLFDVLDEPRTIEITVAPRPDGVFGVCTY